MGFTLGYVVQSYFHSQIYSPWNLLRSFATFLSRLIWLKYNSFFFFFLIHFRIYIYICVSSIYIFLKLSTYFSLRMPYYVEKETGKIIPDISRLLKIIRITNRRKRDFAATRRKKESRNDHQRGSLSLLVFSFTSVFFGRRVNALVEFSSFYFSRVCPLTFRFFPPILLCDPIACRN